MKKAGPIPIDPKRKKLKKKLSAVEIGTELLLRPSKDYKEFAEAERFDIETRYKKVGPDKWIGFKEPELILTDRVVAHWSAYQRPKILPPFPAQTD